MRPASASLVDWPIGYRELEPYYERAEIALGVAGRADANLREARHGAAGFLSPRFG